MTKPKRIEAQKPQNSESLRFLDDHVRPVTSDVTLLCKEWRDKKVSSPAVHELTVSYNFYDGGDFIDVGAYHGMYSWCLAPKAKGAKFLSVEALHKYVRYTDRVCACLAHLFRNTEFYTIAQAASDTNLVGDYGGPKSFKSFRPGKRERKRSAVLVDDLVDELGMKPTFMKVDTEGAELFVLRGARKTIERHCPKLMVELHHKCHSEEPTSTKEVVGFLELMGYNKVCQLGTGQHGTVRTYWMHCESLLDISG